MNVTANTSFDINKFSTDFSSLQPSNPHPQTLNNPGISSSNLTTPRSNFSTATSTATNSSITISKLLDENKLLRNEVTTISNDFKSISEQLHALKNENRNLFDEKTSLEKNYKTKNQKTLEIIKKEQVKNETANRKVENLERQNAVYKIKLTKLMQTKTEISNLQEKLNQNLVSSNVEISDLKNRLETSELERVQLIAQIEDFNLQEKLKNEQLTNLREELEKIDENHEKLVKMKDEDKNTINTQTNDINLLQNEIQNITSKYQQMNYELDLGKQRVFELEQLLEKSKEQNKKLQNEIYESRNETASANQMSNLLKKEIETQKDRISELNFKHQTEKMNLISDLPIFWVGTTLVLTRNRGALIARTS